MGPATSTVKQARVRGSGALTQTTCCRRVSCARVLGCRRYSNQVRVQMQQVLLDRTAHEPIHSVRRGLADVVAATAQHSVPAGQWPNLLDFLHQCSQADSAEHKEVALLLFGRLFETVGGWGQTRQPGKVACIGCTAGGFAADTPAQLRCVHTASGYASSAAGPVLLLTVHMCVRPFSPSAAVLCAGEHLAPHTPTILSAIAAGTTHPSPLVQTAALTAVEPLLPFVTDDLVPAFHQLLAALLPCAQAAVASANEDLLVLLCQVRLQLPRAPAQPAPCQQPYSALVGIKHGS